MKSLVKLSAGLLLVAAAFACKLPTTEQPPAVAPPPDTRSWTEHVVPGTRGWSRWGSVASSADGMRLAATVAGGFIYTSVDGGLTWTERTASGARGWCDITSSADGTRLAATVPYGSIYVSRDGGATWAVSSGTRKWAGITCSSDGTKLAATVSHSERHYPYSPEPPGYIYTSSDGGNSWTEHTSPGSRLWGSIASSEDGSRLVVDAGMDRDDYGSYIFGCAYTSADGGQTWTRRVSASIGSVTSSSDGLRLAAALGGGFVSTSTDGGVTWTQRTTSGRRDWRGIAGSADGMRLAAIVNNGCIYTSADGGATWNERVSPSAGTLAGIASSADGLRITATAYNGNISTSADGGLTWTEYAGAGARSWAAICGSADGSKLAAAAYGGYIYSSTDGGASWTERTAAGCRAWMTIVSSADGTRLAATAGGSVFTSADGGLSWTDRTCPGVSFTDAIASSSDGTKLAAIATYGAYANYVYTSVDSGITWTQRSATGTRIACSADGTRLAVSQGDVLTSTDGGATWTRRMLYYVSPYGPGSVTSSADGSRLAAVITFDSVNAGPGDWHDDFVCASADGGDHWVRSEQVLPGDYISLAGSVDGSRLVAAVACTASDGWTSRGGSIYTSTDGGVSWGLCVNAGERFWKGVTSSADGTRLAAVDGKGTSIFTSP